MAVAPPTWPLLLLPEEPLHLLQINPAVKCCPEVFLGVGKGQQNASLAQVEGTSLHFLGMLVNVPHTQGSQSWTPMWKGSALPCPALPHPCSGQWVPASPSHFVIVSLLLINASGTPGCYKQKQEQSGVLCAAVQRSSKEMLLKKAASWSRPGSMASRKYMRNCVALAIMEPLTFPLPTLLAVPLHLSLLDTSF